MSFFKVLPFKPEFLSLIRDLGNWFQHWTLKRVSSVVPALQLRYVTVCVPGPSLNISHCRSLQGSLREGEGTIINRSLLHQPIPSALSLSSLPLTLYLCRALPLNSQHTASFSFFFTPPFLLLPLTCRLSVSVSFFAISATTFLRLAGQIGNGSERCMWWGALLFCVRDAAPSVRACFPSPAPHHPHPPPPTQSCSLLAHREATSLGRCVSPAVMEGVFLISLSFPGDSSLILRIHWIWPISICTF